MNTSTHNFTNQIILIDIAIIIALLSMSYAAMNNNDVLSIIACEALAAASVNIIYILKSIQL